MDSVKVLLVEDYKMVRLGLSLVFENTEGIDLIGEAEDGKKGVSLALKLNPDVVLMDIGLPEMDGIQATSMIKKSNPNIKSLINSDRYSEALTSIRNGAIEAELNKYSEDKLENIESKIQEEIKSLKESRELYFGTLNAAY